MPKQPGAGPRSLDAQREGSSAPPRVRHQRNARSLTLELRGPKTQAKLENRCRLPGDLLGPSEL
eukprot:6390994-Pyramimonas_sp.AAC.1